MCITKSFHIRYPHIHNMTSHCRLFTYKDAGYMVIIKYGRYFIVGINQETISSANTNLETMLTTKQAIY